MRNNLAVQVHTHGFTDITIDTLNRVKTHLTDKTIIVSDQAGWQDIHKIKGVEKVCGVYHKCIHGPYRNQIIGLSRLYRKYPECEWYGNVEWDVAINDSRLLIDLEKAKGCWTAGFDLRQYDTPWPVLSSKIGREIKTTRYYIGCCLFFHHDFIKICEEEGFFAKILHTSRVYGPHWPDYRDWSVDEALLPSIAQSYDKPGYEFGCWDEDRNRDVYAVRYRPEWKELPENWSVVHPLKDMKLRNFP